MDPASRLASLLALTSFLVAATARADPPEDYPFQCFDAGLAQARREAKPVFVYFGRFGWCDEVNRKTFSDPALKALYTRHYVLVYLDAESGRRLRLPTG